MSFTTPNGTHGAQFPDVERMRQMNERAIATIRAGGSAFPGSATLVLITIGRKSGLERETPMACFPTQDGSLIVIASAAGAVRHPSWYFNLAANPDQVRVVLEGREFAVTAEELHGQERDSVWQQITTAAPGFAQYETLTDRQIPVIRLTPTN